MTLQLNRMYIPDHQAMNVLITGHPSGFAIHVDGIPKAMNHRLGGTPRGYPLDTPVWGVPPGVPPGTPIRGVPPGGTPRGTPIPGVPPGGTPRGYPQGVPPGYPYPGGTPRGYPLPPYQRLIKTPRLLFLT